MVLNNFVKEKLEKKEIIVHSHYQKQARNRNLSFISLTDICTAILNGQVIEVNWSINNGGKYLVYCACKNKILHVSLEYNDTCVLLKTIYEPNKDKGYEHIFESDLKTRANGKLFRNN